MRTVERSAEPFNWETAYGSPERIAWLKANHDKPVTEEEYLEHIKSLPHNHLHAAQCRQPHKNRRAYHHLKERFGFFDASSSSTS